MGRHRRRTPRWALPNPCGERGYAHGGAYHRARHHRYRVNVATAPPGDEDNYDRMCIARLRLHRQVRRLPFASATAFAGAMCET